MSADKKKIDDHISRMTDEELLAYGKRLKEAGGMPPEVEEKLEAARVAFAKAVEAEKVALKKQREAEDALTVTTFLIAQRSPALALTLVHAAAAKREKRDRETGNK